MITFLLYAATSVYALPTNTTTTSGPALLFINPTGKVALLWTSIGLAVATSFWQGVIVTIVTIAEDQGMWTFRFRIARYEHWWWSVVSVLLSISFCLIVLSFLSGNSSDSLGVLTLSTATAISIVRYAIPAWRNRIYIRLRWLSWTGPSRTAIPAKFRGARLDWARIRRLSRPSRLAAPTPSDDWGWAISAPNGIAQDPTALLQGLHEENPEGPPGLTTTRPCVYDDGYASGQVSLLWGEGEGFRRRVSRAINSMPGTLLKSVPSTFDGFSGTGLCLAMGILGRNKGLAPSQLVFDIHGRRERVQNGVAPAHKVTAELEATSAWYPRPNKVMRSFYQKAMEDQYAGLGPDFVGVAVELALILLDCPPHAVLCWLEQSLEQQSMDLNQCMANASAAAAELQTLYRASYASMIVSINYFAHEVAATAHRPDLTCFALLWLAEEGTAPEWWDERWVQSRLLAEAASLKGSWKRAASWLLGLGDVPSVLDLDSWPVWSSEPSTDKSELG